MMATTARRQRRRRRDKALILCSAIGDTGNAPIPPGYGTDDCSQCRRPVWVSPEARALVRLTGVTPVFACSRCTPLPGVTPR
jgi:hypothetical protein